MRIQLDQRLKEHFKAYRSDALRFALFTIVLTPLFLALSAFLILVATQYVDLPIVDKLGYSASFALGMTITLTFMAYSPTIRPTFRGSSHARRGTREKLGWSCIGVLWFLSLQMPWEESFPILFWLTYSLTAFLGLAALAGSYTPHDHYYLGVWNGMIDDPFTTEDDVDRAHYMLGIVAAIPAGLLAAYSHIFGDRWLWKDYDRADFRLAAHILAALAEGLDVTPQNRFPDAPAHRRVTAIKMLFKFEFIRIRGRRLSLHSKGKEFLKN